MIKTKYATHLRKGNPSKQKKREREAEKTHKRNAEAVDTRTQRIYARNHRVRLLWHSQSNQRVNGDRKRVGRLRHFLGNAPKQCAQRRAELEVWSMETVGS